MPTLSVCDLACGYRAGKRPVLSGVSFDLREGEMLCVLGPNGSGKSTLFRTLLGLLPALHGDILLDGASLPRLNHRERARLVAYVPQSSAPAFAFSVLDMVLMGRSCHLPRFGQPSAADEYAAMRALEIMGLASLARRAFTECSGGERQMILCARALAQGSPALILDEPTASLDFGNALRMMEHLRDMADQGHLLLISTHNPEMALHCAHKVLLLHDGNVAGFGPPEPLLDEDMILRLYGVRTQRLALRGERGTAHIFMPV